MDYLPLKALGQQVYLLLLLGLFQFLAIGIGLLVLKRICGFHINRRGDILFFAVALGWGSIGYTIFFLGIGHFYHPLGLTLTVIGLSGLSLWGWLDNLWIFQKKIKIPLPDSFLERLACFFLFVLLFFDLLLVLTPDAGKDAYIYHLAVPKLYLKYGGIFFIPGNIFSNYPLLNECLFVLALFFDGAVLAKLLHWTALLWILLGLRQYAYLEWRIHRYPYLSMLIFASIPSVFILSHMAYIDLFLTFYIFAALYAFLHWRINQDAAYLLVTGILTGFALGSKYNALILPILGCLGILIYAHYNNKGIKIVLGQIWLFLFTAILIGSPFYIKNALLTGNPFFPFLYHIFGGRGWDPEQARVYEYFVASLGMGRSFFDYLMLPIRLSLYSKLGDVAFDGVLGPVYLFTLPFLIGVKKLTSAIKVILIFCLLFFFFWAATAQQIRYLVPLFPLLAVAVGYVADRYSRKNVFAIILWGTIGFSLVFNLYYLQKDFREIRPLSVLLGIEKEENFMRRRIHAFDSIIYCNQFLPKDAKIFLIYMKNMGYLFERDYFSDSMFETYTLQKILKISRTPLEIREAMLRSGFTHVLYDHTYVFGSLSSLSEEEKWRLMQFKELFLIPEFIKEPYYLYRIK